MFMSIALGMIISVRKHLDLLLTRKIHSSRYICTNTLQTLGIFDDVKLLYDQIGIWDFLTQPFPTYIPLTYEFLSTLNFLNDFTRMEFRLFGQFHDITVDQLNEICGFPTSAGLEEPLNQLPPWGNETNETCATFKQLICDQVDEKSKYRGKIIKHPALRYIQRALAFTIFGRGETSSNINIKDIYFLYIMLHVYADPSLKPCIGTMIFRHLKSVIDNTRTGGTISMGGIVSRIVYAFGYFDKKGLPMSKPDKQTPKIDLDSLVKAHLIQKVGNSWHHLAWYGQSIPLPWPPIVIHDPTTWQPPQLAPVDIYPPPPMPDQHQAHPSTSHAVPPPVQDPNQPTMQQLMDYMSTQFGEIRTEYNENFTNLNNRIDTLNSDFGAFRTETYNRLDNLSNQYTTLQGRVNALHDYHPQYNQRFDDLYHFHDDTHSMLHSVHHLSSQFANMYVASGQIVEEEHLNPPNRRRRQPRYPFSYDGDHMDTIN